MKIFHKIVLGFFCGEGEFVAGWKLPGESLGTGEFATGEILRRIFGENTPEIFQEEF